jgi:PAP2 superfamily protein
MNPYKLAICFVFVFVSTHVAAQKNQSGAVSVSFSDTISIKEAPEENVSDRIVTEGFGFASLNSDTLLFDPVKKATFASVMKNITSSKAYKMTYIGVPLIIGGLILKHENAKFRSLRNDFVPNYNTKIDDYIQYLPAAVMLGLKVGGVKGRSSWPRMLVSDAFSVALMAATVNIIKETSKEMRPDGSNNRSFPSGHTATAFMCATMMHKEYGKVSPWYSIGAYSVATFTGVSRILNNKHWINDVLVGAGIGILSTELGYLFADLIFKKRGLNELRGYPSFDKTHKPSFLGLYLGLNLPLTNYNLPEYGKLSLNPGANAGLEGAYFFNPYIGAGGIFSFSNMPVKLNNISAEKPLDVVSFYVGPYFSFPVCSEILLGTKALVGYVDYRETQVSGTPVGGVNGVAFGTGISVCYLASRSFNIRLFADYNLSKSVIKTQDKSAQTFVFGSTAAMNF